MHISPLPGMCICPFHMSLPQSEQSSRLGSEFFGIPAPMGSTSGLGSCLTLLASFNIILDLPFVGYFP